MCVCARPFRQLYQANTINGRVRVITRYEVGVGRAGPGLTVVS